MWRLIPRPVRTKWSPQEAIEHMVAGMERNGQQAGRITGGEPAMWWDHTVGLIGQFIAQLAVERNPHQPVVRPFQRPDLRG